MSALTQLLAAAPPDSSSCARRGRWAAVGAAGPLHDPTGRAGLDCSSSKSKSARSAVTPGVSGVERAPAAGLHGTRHVDRALSGDVVELARSSCGPGPL